MIVFKTFLKVLYKCKMPVILFTVILILFGVMNDSTSDNTASFTASKPDLVIINQDEEEGITKSFIEYISENSNVKHIGNDNEQLDDALFYREVSYIIYIPEHFRSDFLKGENPKITVKSTGDYEANLAEMLVSRYLKAANVYIRELDSEDEVIRQVRETLSKQAQIEITTQIDGAEISRLVVFFNFANYSLLAGGIYVVCLILSSFKDDKIRKRTMISSVNEKQYNRQLLFSNSLFMIFLWALYCILGSVLLGDIMFTVQGLICVLNSLIFSLCCLTISFLIGNLINNKNAINGIINVVALGSSFLCGAFIPMEWLPDSILAVAHFLPSYYYIKTNECLKQIEVFNAATVQPIVINTLVIIIFMIVFITITNVVSRRKRKIG
ncbi:MAG: ABC transporter permease [Lachnospiraceae bacterium]